MGTLDIVGLMLGVVVVVGSSDIDVELLGAVVVVGALDVVDAKAIVGEYFGKSVVVGKGLEEAYAGGIWVGTSVEAVVDAGVDSKVGEFVKSG